MSGTPAIGRVSNLMLQQIALGGINRTTLDMFKVQNQLSTGVTVGKYSDDPVKAAVITVLNERLGRSEQVKRNLQHATSALGLLDKTLSDASDLAREAKDIASNQLSFGTTAAERKNQAIVVDQMIKSLFGLANRQSVAGYMFGGSQTSRAPVEEFFGGYRYVGDGAGLVTDLDQASTIPITLGAGSAIGEVSSRVRGSVDLNPNLTTTTRLADLGGGRGVGVTLGTVGFAFNGGPTATVDLAGSDTAQDVITRLTAAIRQYETDNSVTVLGAGGVSIANGRFSIDVATGGTLQFSEVGTGVTARDLGLVSDTAPFAFTPTTTWGVDVNPKLTWRSPVASLAGVTGALGTIRISNAGRTALVDLSGATTLQDVRNRIESAGIGARVEINANGTGIDVFNEVAAGSNKSLSIEEVAGGDTATRLGIRSFSGSTLLSDFNFGRGVGIVKNAVNPLTGLADINYDYDFSVRLGDAAGTVLRFDLQPANMTNVQTMLSALNTQASAQLTAAGLGATDLQFGLATDGNGLRLTQNAGFTGTLKVETMNNSTAATDLGLIGGRYDSATTSWIGEDRAKVRVNNLFNALIDLRDSLSTSDTSGIGFAGADLETSVASLAEVRGLVGSYARRVDDASDREGDRNVLDEQVRSQLRDTDFAAASSRFTLLQTQLQAALRTTATSQQLSLLDFLGYGPGGSFGSVSALVLPAGRGPDRMSPGVEPGDRSMLAGEVRSFAMEVRTTRFGVIDIAEDRVITFPKGLLGFADSRRYCLLEPSDEACFFWLQSLDDAALAFVVTDPALFVPEFKVPIRPEQMTDLGVEKLEDAQVFVIVNKIDQQLTGNLQGPLVINTLTRMGEQMVLAEKRWTTRHPLIQVRRGAQAMSA